MSRARLVLILCPERSGSTLLSSMLGANPQVLAPPELFLLRYADYATWRRNKPAAFASLQWLLQRTHEPAERIAIENGFRQSTTVAVYQTLLEVLGEGKILVDKTPAYGRETAALARAEQLEPRYLWLVRHPLGVANSWVERRTARRWRGAGEPGKAAAARFAASTLPPLRSIRERLDRAAVRAALGRWCLVNQTVADFLGTVAAKRVYRLAYEDLVSSPEDTARGVCRWMEVPFSREMLRPWEHLPDSLTWGLGDGKIRSQKTIDAGRAESWRERWSEDDLDERTRATMERVSAVSRPSARPAP